MAQPCSWKRCEKGMGWDAGRALHRPPPHPPTPHPTPGAEPGRWPFPAFQAPSALSLKLPFSGPGERKFSHCARCRMLKRMFQRTFITDCLNQISHQETMKNKPTGSLWIIALSFIKKLFGPIYLLNSWYKYTVKFQIISKKEHQDYILKATPTPRPLGFWFASKRKLQMQATADRHAVFFHTDACVLHRLFCTSFPLVIDLGDLPKSFNRRWSAPLLQWMVWMNHDWCSQFTNFLDTLAVSKRKVSCH